MTTNSLELLVLFLIVALIINACRTHIKWKKTIIIPKFNIGDEVWWISPQNQCFNTKWEVHGPGKVSHIEAYVNSLDNKYVSYEIGSENTSVHFTERHVFSSPKAAKAKCVKRDAEMVRESRS